jgi:hypothetical protein
MLTRTRQARADAFRAEMLARINAAAAEARGRRGPQPVPEELRRS